MALAEYALEAKVTLSPEFVAQLIQECDILRERESGYIRQAQVQERCIASLRRKLTDVENELRRSYVHHQS
jgi:hypothetical protein